MSVSVLTLAAADVLEPAAVDAARAALARAGARLDAEPAWLAPGVACDLRFGDLDPRVAEEAARAALDAAAVDCAAQPAAGRRKRLLVADMESTVIRNEMLDELAERVGKRSEVAGITARAMRGELDFRAALAERVALLRGLPVAALERAARRISIDPGARVLVATLAARGARTALVSGGFHFFADPVAARLGFDHRRANRLGIEDGRLTGRVLEPILDRDAKLATLDELCRRYGLERADAAAVGDGANDLALLRAAGLGVAFHAKPVVAKAARYRVDHGDLRTLLYYQGYPETEWAR